MVAFVTKMTELDLLLHVLPCCVCVVGDGDALGTAVYAHHCLYQPLCAGEAFLCHVCGFSVTDRIARITTSSQVSH